MDAYPRERHTTDRDEDRPKVQQSLAMFMNKSKATIHEPTTSTTTASVSASTLDALEFKDGRKPLFVVEFPNPAIVHDFFSVAPTDKKLVCQLAFRQLPPQAEGTFQSVQTNARVRITDDIKLPNIIVSAHLPCVVHYNPESDFDMYSKTIEIDASMFVRMFSAVDADGSAPIMLFVLPETRSSISFVAWKQLPIFVQERAVEGNIQDYDEDLEVIIPEASQVSPVPAPRINASMAAAKFDDNVMDIQLLSKQSARGDIVRYLVKFQTGSNPASTTKSIDYVSYAKSTATDATFPLGASSFLEHVNDYDKVYAHRIRTSYLSKILAKFAKHDILMTSAKSTSVILFESKHKSLRVRVCVAAIVNEDSHVEEDEDEAGECVVLDM